MTSPTSPSVSPTARSGFLSRLFSRQQWKSAWLPLAATVAFVVLALLPIPWPADWISGGFGLAYLAGLLWFLGLAIARFIRKQIAAGIGAIACLLASLAPLVPMLLFLLVVALDDSGDNFAEGLALPEGIELSEPNGDLPFEDTAGGATDTFQTAIRASLAIPGGNDPALTVSLTSLERLSVDHSALLERYLAAHPGWRVYEEKGRRFATRRWMVEDRWQMSLHGYYSSFHGPDGPTFQTRTTIGLAGKPWNRSGQRLAPGIPTKVDLEPGNQMWESHVMVPAGGLLVEQFEQSDAKERRITRAALAELEREFADLLADPKWESAKARLPEGAILRGEPAIELSKSFQGGIYNAQVRCNPGEAGRIFLKATEITRSHPLSEKRLKEASTEWIGWSDDPTEQFLSETHFTIYEGNWGQYYGARFEVWFEPDGGDPPRKLLERNFKIEGWMR